MSKTQQTLFELPPRVVAVARAKQARRARCTACDELCATRCSACHQPMALDCCQMTATVCQNCWLYGDAGAGEPILDRDALWRGFRPKEAQE